MYVQEAYTPRKLTVSGTLFTGSGSTALFLCTSAGTLAVSEGADAGGSNVIAEFSVEAGKTYIMPFAFGDGAYATLGGGAAGTFGVTL